MTAEKPDMCSGQRDQRSPSDAVTEEDVRRAIKLLDGYWQLGRQSGIAETVLIAAAITQSLTEMEHFSGETAPALLLEALLERSLSGDWRDQWPGRT